MSYCRLEKVTICQGGERKNLTSRRLFLDSLKEKRTRRRSIDSVVLGGGRREFYGISGPSFYMEKKRSPSFWSQQNSILEKRKNPCRLKKEKGYVIYSSL